MKLYRITSEKYASKLEASGRANRWSREKQYVIYASSSRALAALELVAHRNAIMQGLNYKTVVINVPEQKNLISNVDLKKLQTDWHFLKNYSHTQKIGTDWYESKKSVIFKVPSAIVREEYNYVINTMHPDFDLIEIDGLENFAWDKRLL